MDQQGSGWTRSAADTRRPGSWARPPDDASSADPRDMAHTDPQPRLRPPAHGSGAQPTLGGGSGAQRMPERGFPPARPSGRDGTGTGSWSAPPSPDLDHEYAPAGGYVPHDANTGPHQVSTGPYATSTGPYATASGPAAGNTDPIARVDPQPPEAVTLPAGRRRSAKARTERRLASRPRLLAGIAVVVAAALGLGGYKLFYEPRVNAPVSPSLRLPTTAPPSSALDQTLGKWQHIGTRTQDPDPLTVTALFPPQFVLGGSSYLRTAASVTSKCSQAVYGTQLQAALKSGHCTQVARATYLSGNGQMMGTVGVVNLDSSADASKAGQVSGSQEIIAPLSAKKGPTQKLGNGTGVVQAEVKGHYLILMWAEFANLKSPSTTAAKASLEQFATDLVTGSANINLSTRMLSGKA